MVHTFHFYLREMIENHGRRSRRKVSHDQRDQFLRQQTNAVNNIKNYSYRFLVYYVCIIVYTTEIVKKILEIIFFITVLKYFGSLPLMKKMNPLWHISFCVIFPAHTVDAKIFLIIVCGRTIPFVNPW